MIAVLSLSGVATGLKPVAQKVHRYRARRCQGCFGFWLLSMLQGLGFKVKGLGFKVLAQRKGGDGLQMLAWGWQTLGTSI